MPWSRISQYAFSQKVPESASRIRLMNRPSTVAEGGDRVIIPLTKIHATPSKGRMPSTRESTRFIERQLPPVIFCAVPRVVLFGPELVSGAANENVFEGWFAHRNCLDLAGKSFDDFSHKAVRAFPFHAYLVFENGCFHVKARLDALGQQ